MSILSDLSRPSEVTDTKNKRRFSTQEICHAFKVTLTYMVADSFNLTDEESTWTSYHITQILIPLSNKPPVSLPSAVTHELNTRQYSKSVTRRKDGTYFQAEDGGEVADLTGWVDVIMSMVITTYEPDIITQAQIRAKFTSLLEDLGVGKAKNPRAAFYLPNAIRWNAAQKKDRLSYGI